MSEQQKVEILKRVEKGEISVDEALKLIEDAERQARSAQRAEGIADVKSALSDVLQEASESLRGAGEVVNDAFTEVGRELRENQDIRGALSGLLGGIFNLGGGHTFYYTHEGSFAQDQVKVTLRSSNGALHLKNWDGEGYKLIAKVSVRAATESEAKALSQEVYSFSSFDNELRMEVKPNIRWGGVSAELFLPSNKQYIVQAETSNGSISLHDVVGSELVADTSNGSVTLMGCNFADAKVETSNGSVTLNGHCGQLKVDTSNGSIRVDSAGVGESMLDLSTSNGSITLLLNRHLDTGYSVEASSSNGRVSADLQGLHVTTSGKNKLSAKSENYDACKQHTKVQARTSNGRITISHRD